MDEKIKKIVILFSGEGSNAENIVKKLHKKESGGICCEIAGAICNNKYANGISRLKKYGIDTKILEHDMFSSREEFDRALVEEIISLKADLTVLAGFMRILTPVFTDTVKAINLHPSILPLFKGANAIKRSFESDMKVAGVSVHMVSSELDGGEIVEQECFKKDEKDSYEEFCKKIKRVEFEILPSAIIKILKKEN